MRIYVLVEGRSEEALLTPWLKRFQPNHIHLVIPHQGKGHIPPDPTAQPDPKRRGLLDQLPAKLRAYGKSLNKQTDRVLVLVDADTDPCQALKQRMEALLNQCAPKPEVAFRVAVEETEAFYLGDPRAIRRVFGPLRQGPYQNYVQDSICGTWEVFQVVIAARHEDKVAWAEAIAPHLSTATRGRLANRSPSFRQLCQALRLLAGEQWP